LDQPFRSLCLEAEDATGFRADFRPERKLFRVNQFLVNGSPGGGSRGEGSCAGWAL